MTRQRDLLLGGGLLGSFAFLLASTVRPLGQDAAVGPAMVVAGIAMLAAIGLTWLLWPGGNDRVLLLFPFALYAGEVALTSATNGISTSYSGFFALSIIYVGLTQRRQMVPLVVAFAAPCWLYGQEVLSARILVRLGIAVAFWVLVGFALSSRTQMARQRTAELLDRANTDALTGLASRLFLADQIDQELRDPTAAESCVMVIDLDGFKAVNDMFGHAVGDGVLITVAGWLRSSFRPGDVCARLGGDEFAVLLRHAGVRQATEAAGRLLEQMARPVELPRGRMSVTASVGIASLNGAPDSQNVLRDADLAMYEAKSAGRNRAATYAPELGQRREARLQLEAELHDGLVNDEFELYYQPVVHLQTGAVIGTEALLRWNHPTRGVLAPDQFLSASEDIGVIVTLGGWILEQACAQAVKWQPADPANAVSMAVNVSATELLAPGFVNRVRDVLASTGLPGRLLILEITEQLVVVDAHLACDRMEELRRLGVRVAIDDFGTGYSSIAYLRQLPVDIIKIDQSFVRPLGNDAQTTALLKAVVAIAEALRLDIIVEGVETPAHVAILDGLGCEVAQGYHFARPGTADTITALLKNERSVTSPA